MRTRIILGAVAATLLAVPALAHPGHDQRGLVAGLMHPIGGVDHLAAMLAVGLWAGLVGGERRWVWPACFVVAMVAGAAAGWSGLPVPVVETVIAASVLALGAAIATGWSPTVAVGGALIAAFGLAHGFAHGAEMPAGSLLSGYAAGFVGGTALLHAVGLALAAGLAAYGARVAPRVAGGALASLGLVLLAGTLVA
jgi:urease accessory protein